MNYIVEDDFDFYGELQEKTDEVTDLAVCMISHETLTYNSVTLSCKHPFNYLPLYNELCLHNNKIFIICPYCRKKADKLIPFIPLPTVGKIYGVNYPVKMCMPAPKCTFLIEKGSYKGLMCEHTGMEYEYGNFCPKHVKYNVNTEWTPEKAALFKSKSVPQLKELLRIKGLKVGGVKKELVHRLFL
jgi:hypothetical protein